MGSNLSIPFSYNFVKPCLLIGTFILSGFSYVYYKRNETIEKFEPYSRVVFITGCDSGLGYSFARYSYNLNFTVIASFLNINSPGAIQLKEYCGEHLISLEIDLRDDKTIKYAANFLEKYFDVNNNKVFHALINNAGIMVFGEYDWQTLYLIDEQIKINLMGTFHITHMCLPLIRKHKGRIITVTSHCSDVTLPGLSVYGATKAALSALNDGLRLELGKYGVHVVKFVPGSLFLQSNILNRLKNDRAEIENNLTSEKKMFYNDYIDRYYNYLCQLPVPKNITHINNGDIYKKYEHALLSKYPKTFYKIEPMHYKLNHFLFKIVPIRLRDYLVIRFVQLPKWESVTE